MDSLSAISKVASSAMRAQQERLRVTAENMANADSAASEPGADPYRRKVVSFDELVDERTGAKMVHVKEVYDDPSEFRLEYDPSHPAADAAGYVKMPNVNAIVELANMREATRSYEANLNLYESGRKMRGQLIDMLN